MFSTDVLFKLSHLANFSFPLRKKKPNIFLGAVYIDGVEKPTKLPALTRGSVLSFETVVLPDGDKVRVTIEVNERIVTFDWTLQETQKSTAESPVSLSGFAFPARSDRDKNLYFAARFHHKDWKISVE